MPNKPTVRLSSDQRRADLVSAGLQLLALTGWAGVTQRAVAERAGANPGLVHYYFSGSAGLRLAIVEEACRRQVGGLVALLDQVADVPELLSRVEAELSGARSPDDSAVLAAVVSLATTDDRFAAVVNTHLRAARSAVAEWLLARDRRPTPGAAASTAAALVALIDGLALHQAMDREVSAAGLADALRTLARTDAEAAVDGGS